MRWGRKLVGGTSGSSSPEAASASPDGALRVPELPVGWAAFSRPRVGPGVRIARQHLLHSFLCFSPDAGDGSAGLHSWLPPLGSGSEAFGAQASLAQTRTSSGLVDPGASATGVRGLNGACTHIPPVVYPQRGEGRGSRGEEVLDPGCPRRANPVTWQKGPFTDTTVDL